MKTRQNTFLPVIAVMLLGVGLPAVSWSGLLSASGGDKVYDIQEGDILYRVHLFTNTGPAMLTVSNGGFVDCLLVGGGGGGGETIGGGGGGGGVVEILRLSVTSGVYAVTVGAGGAGGWDGAAVYPAGMPGERSGFSSLSAIGGGAGAGYNVAASETGSSAGGNGGGGGARAGYTLGQGSDGGLHWENNAGGGGGGAGTAGKNATAAGGGAGGGGVATAISGTLTDYGGGGGGGTRDPTGPNAGAGGRGGGGKGGRATEGQNGGANTGGGGGGGGFIADLAGGQGGSGIVLIRYAEGPITPAPSVMLADVVTGSTRFTSTNGVKITAVPQCAGYDKFQCTGTRSSILALDSKKWVSTNDLAAYFFTIDRPIADTNITLYVWFTHTTDTTKPLLRSIGQITVTSVAPVPAVKPTLTRGRLAGAAAIITAEDIEKGSLPGTANGARLELHARRVRTVNPADNLTPEASYASIGAAGTYPVALGLQNEAGNVALSRATCLVTVVDLDAATNFWTGAGLTDRWCEGANWIAGSPGPGQHVAITGATDTVILDAPCAPLASLTMTAGTLTFTNWTACLRAERVELRGGELTLPPPFVNQAMSNRVHVQCADFTLQANAKIDVTGKGFAGGKLTGNGPGGNSGASYGGTRLEFGFPATYGSVRAPIDPGSGGGSLNTDIVGGAGGGAVWIEATGTATIYGSILSDGKGGSDIHSSGGSGGSIYITCNRFEGSGNGLLSVCGARGSYICQGGGSGGRIAVVYNTLAQAGHNPGVRFASVGGHWAATGYGQVAYWPDRRCNEQGTLYCADASFLSTDLGSGQFKGVTFQTGSLTAWTPPNLTVSNGTAITFYHDDGFTLNVPGDLRVDQATLGVSGPGALACGGDLTLTDTSQLRVYSATANAVETGPGECVEVAGRLVIESGSRLYLITHPIDGNPVSLRINSMSIAPNGGINYGY